MAAGSFDCDEDLWESVSQSGRGAGDDGGSLGTGGQTLGVQTGSVAVDDAVHHAPVHRLVRPAGNLSGVRVIQQEHPRADKAAALALLIAVEDRGQLLAGDVAGRVEAPVAVYEYKMYNCP